MKLIFVCLAICIALVDSESCHVDGDCNYEHCPDSGWTLTCHHGILSGIIGAGSTGQCTCDQDGHLGAACSGAGQCTPGGCPTKYLTHHCVDGHCKCQIRGIGK